MQYKILYMNTVLYTVNIINNIDMIINIATDILTVSYMPWNKKMLLRHGLCIFVILEAVKVRMAT